ncbi:Plant Tudor-like RNA-binding protein [Euphorbia peplus]|nr:Plant Tudor-like RNA-binding protein [Euphorbia peplus]
MKFEEDSLRQKLEKDDVRRRKKWRVGDVAQVFHNKCWRVGKIVKVLKKNNCVVRLFGSIQLREFHESSLRIWQNEAQYSGNLVYSSKLEANRKHSCSRKRDMQKYVNGGHGNVNKCLPARTKNRSNTCKLQKSCKDIPSCVGERNLPPGEVRVLEKFNADMAKAATHKRKNSSRLLLIEDSDQCSVASCSSNNLLGSPLRYNCNKAFADSSDNSDAESSFPSSAHFEEKLEADIHELEFHAYKSTVRALYASGPLSWDQESLLTNLRLSLHISDDEHLLHLRHLLSAHVL